MIYLRSFKILRAKIEKIRAGTERQRDHALTRLRLNRRSMWERTSTTLIAGSSPLVAEPDSDVAEERSTHQEGATVRLW